MANLQYCTTLERDRFHYTKTKNDDILCTGAKI